MGDVWSLLWANFLEPPRGEVRRTILPGTPLNRGTHASWHAPDDIPGDKYPPLAVLCLSVQSPNLPLSSERPHQRKEEGRDEPAKRTQEVDREAAGYDLRTRRPHAPGGTRQAPGPATEAGGGVLRGRCPERVTRVQIGPFHLLIVAAPVIRL